MELLKVTEITDKNKIIFVDPKEVLNTLTNSELVEAYFRGLHYKDKIAIINNLIIRRDYVIDDLCNIVRKSPIKKLNRHQHCFLTSNIHEYLHFNKNYKKKFEYLNVYEQNKKGDLVRKLIKHDFKKNELVDILSSMTLSVRRCPINGVVHTVMHDIYKKGGV